MAARRAGTGPVTVSFSATLWRYGGKGGRTELAVPRRVRGTKDDGDTVAVSLTYARDDD